MKTNDLLRKGNTFGFLSMLINQEILEEKPVTIRRMSTIRTDSQENRHIPLAHISPHSSALNRTRKRELRANTSLSQLQLPANPEAPAQIQASSGKVDFSP